ncbi:MAG: peptidylprolyl isomerase [Bacteroidetes bacterium]|jgi:peptidyl-prolyl cis-trans isomerase B (cyclophilin B)|nr:peptidylprolyl isomerase [Bacteroidota bacterium]MBT4397922.1 peptidylprolyl isomerase [Bacteroidota bacterium]MBT4412434.1 peptidylprolyl isomerase [Bacteroidota bacterium]MBT5427887.1 peptidylprolyl isomerase [Bacteroidota bacterium]MBT7464293.1 peptidylprolyl isomerase [Bacteroidota bacterium]
MNKLTVLSCLFLILAGASCKKETYPVGQIITPQGEMLFWLYDETPLHKTSFITLANENYWDSLTMNRVIENFVVQGGCPDTREGFSNSPYLIEPEFNDSIKHIYGAVGAGRDNNPDKISAGCQLYIVHAKEGLPRLDGDYMIFGQIFKGLDVLDEIAKVDCDKSNKPLIDVTLNINVINLSAKELDEYGYHVSK